ncbi:MAG: FkbM family methyltransferase [Selenomonadaceae bacterium]|nr:FkbM family methyltransferase [Selenomonadaceae bacterium]
MEKILNYILITEYVKSIHERLSIKDVVDHNYIRVGRDFDGGYVMVDDFKNVKNVYSCGISDDVSWDVDFTGKIKSRGGGADIFMYDHTIDHLPQEAENFHWFKLGITGKFDPQQPELETLSRLIERNDHLNDYNMILKIDIEGAEWDVLEHIDVDTLDHFSQIIIEMHWFLNKFDKPTGLENKILFALDKLNATHQLVHIHGNNASPIYIDDKTGKVVYTAPGVIRDGLILPNCLECTYLHKDRYKFKPSRRFFPTPLDMPCDPGRLDINLGFWK